MNCVRLWLSIYKEKHVASMAVDDSSEMACFTISIASIAPIAGRVSK